MKKLGKDVYRRNGMLIEVVHEQEKVKVKFAKTGNDDDDEDEADA